MNCRKGDLAIILHSTPPEHIGKIVTCLEWLEWAPGMWVWEIDLKLPGVLHVVIQDHQLRPLRDGGLDEEEPRAATLDNLEGAIA